MTDQTVITKTISDIASKVVMENPNGTSFRVVVYNHPGWDMTTDLSLNDQIQAKAGLNAIGKFVAGGFAGSEKLLVVAPTEKLTFLNGTGTFAYVRNDFIPGKDDIVVDISGKKVLMTVRPGDVPTERGYRRLHLDGTELYAKKWEKLFTASDEDPWTYWYCRAASILVGGQNNLCVSVGPVMKDTADAIMAVVNSEDPKTANQTRLYAGRVTSRFQRGVNEEMATINDTGEQPLSADDLVVPLRDGGTISLKQYHANDKIYLYTEMGLKLSPRKLGSDSDTARLAMAREIKERGYLVGLS